VTPIPSTDPFTAFFNHDWASVGGWSLFIGLVMMIVTGSFREWWVPGPRAKRDVALIAAQQELIKQQSLQITKLTEGNEFTKYVMEKVVPRPSKGGPKSTVSRRDDPGRTP
jgi:hypothetical protein